MTKTRRGIGSSRSGAARARSSASDSASIRIASSISSSSSHWDHFHTGRLPVAVSPFLARFALVAILTLFAGCGGTTADDETIARAKLAYARAKGRGVDMSRGPCLGLIEPGWVADVAHDPRQDVDDEPRNQCAAYREGRADHFVELDPEGNYIRSG